MNKWKDQTSGMLKSWLQKTFPEYWSTIDEIDPIWQARYYGFNVFSRRKIEEKLDYMHLNPHRAGFVERAIDWRWSSAGWYLQHRSVGIPIGWPPGMELDDP